MVHWGSIRDLEGRVVDVALGGGERIDAAQLVSAGRRGAPNLWLFVNGADLFVPYADVLEVWESAASLAAA